MDAAKFVDDNLTLGNQRRCPLILFRERCEAVGLTTREVLKEIRSRYGNGSKNYETGVKPPWMTACRMTMPDGSRPRAFEGFAFRDFERLPPTVAKIWDWLPYRGPISEFPVPLTPQQLAGACKFHRIAMFRENKGNVWIAKDTNSEYPIVVRKGKQQRINRQDRKNRAGQRLKEKATADKPMSPLVERLWPHLCHGYHGPITDFPIAVTANQLAGACKSGRVAMIRRKDEILIVRDDDPNYSEILTLGKDERSSQFDRKATWERYLEEFPHPNYS
jgi:hypothetical protein